jgi:hypothetical protein
MANLPKSPPELVDIFGISGDPQFEPIVPFRDGSVGFSILLDYPETRIFKPVLSRNGSQDQVALIRVILQPAEDQQPSIKVPIFIDVSLHYRYLRNHLDYSEDQESPSQDALQAAKGNAKPISLNETGYFLNLESNKIVDSNGVPKIGKELLMGLFELHSAPLHLIRGAPLRFRRTREEKAKAGRDQLIRLFKWILKAGFGRVLEDTRGAETYVSGYALKDLRLTKQDSFVIFGYKAARSSVVLFGISVAATAFAYALFFESGGMADKLFSNPLFVTGIGITVLWAFDFLFPRVLFWTINHLIKRRWRSISKKRPIRNFFKIPW